MISRHELATAYAPDRKRHNSPEIAREVAQTAATIPKNRVALAGILYENRDECHHYRVFEEGQMPRSLMPMTLPRAIGNDRLDSEKRGVADFYEPNRLVVGGKRYTANNAFAIA